MCDWTTLLFLGLGFFAVVRLVSRHGKKANTAFKIFRTFRR